MHSPPTSDIGFPIGFHRNLPTQIAMFIHPSAFGRGPVNDVKKAVAAGLEATIVEVVEHGKDLDYTAMLKRVHRKGVKYVISHTTKPPVATLLKDANRLGLTATTFSEDGKLTFLGAHYTGGPDLVALAGTAAERFYWTTSYTLTSEKGPGTDFQLALAKRYNCGDKVPTPQTTRTVSWLPRSPSKPSNGFWTRAERFLENHSTMS